MRLTIFVITAFLSLTACDSEQERAVKAMEKQIQSVIQQDWSSGIPFDGLVKANNLCQQIHELKYCDVVQQQLDDIAISFSTCQADQRSTLCKTVVHDISKHPIATVLPKAKVLQLPHDPCYLYLPTDMLEAHASNFNYRQETVDWWWQVWGNKIIFCIALFALSYGAWALWSVREKTRKALAAEITRQKVARADQEKVLRIRYEQARAEAEWQEKISREAALAEQRRQTAENIVKQKKAAVAARLATEQEEAARILSAAFKSTPMPKRGKNAIIPE